MLIGQLEFDTFEKSSSILGKPVQDKILQMTKEDQNLCFVASVDKAYIGGQDLCDKYNIDTKMGANCLIVKGKQNGKYVYCALLVPVGCKYDINGVLKNRLGSRMSVAPLEEVLTMTKMEYGSITPVGLPDGWQIFADSSLFEQKRVICGGGKQISKLSIPSKLLVQYCNAEKLTGLAIIPEIK